MIERIINRLSDCGIPELKNIKVLNKLSGGYVNLLCRLPNGATAKILDDDKTYYCCQVEQTDNNKCYGIAADDNQIAVYQYGENGSDAQLILWVKI